MMPLKLLAPYDSIIDIGSIARIITGRGGGSISILQSIVFLCHYAGEQDRINVLKIHGTKMLWTKRYDCGRHFFVD